LLFAVGVECSSALFFCRDLGSWLCVGFWPVWLCFLLLFIGCSLFVGDLVFRLVTCLWPKDWTDWLVCLIHRFGCGLVFMFHLGVAV
jgi:hypothetical protein